MNVALLACPHCAGPDVGLAQVEPGVVGCNAGHRFDLARHGYVALLGPRARTDTADSADMVAARADFLAAGHFAAIAAAVADAVADAAAPGPVLEIGAGTGYYLHSTLDRVGGAGVALDASKFAARRAAADPRITSVLADAWSRLPVRSESMTTVLSVFAPREPTEVARALRPGGVLVAVTPEPAHLAEVRDALGMLSIDPGKPDRLDDAVRGLLVPQSRRLVSQAVRMTAADLSALVRMGPSARHITPTELSGRVAALAAPVEVTVAVTVSVYRCGRRERPVSGPGGTVSRRP